MSSIYPWIYVDYRNSIWKFFQDDNKELRYTIMYGEGKWTKESLIDKEVLGFAVYVEEDETIHIVYSNINGTLKYCTMKNKQWVGKVLYQVDIDEFEIQNLKVEIIGNKMHIFYLLIGTDGSDHGVLMHCIWNGKEMVATELQDIILISNLKEHYSININKENNIKVFFITDEGDEVSLNYCSFENNKWSPGKRLYGIQGVDIEFKVVVDEQEIHILNKSREDSIYCLDHVCIDVSGNIQEFKIYESSKELVEPILFMKSNNLYSCWLEQDKIFYSVFEGEKWSSAFCFDRSSEIVVRRYNCFICCDGDSSIKAIDVYGTNELDLELFVPSQFVGNIRDLLKYEINQNNKAVPKEEEAIQRLKLELAHIKSEMKGLQKKNASLNIQLQKKQKFMEEYEEQIARILEQKRKADENYKVFLELQQNIQKELEDANQKLLEEKEIRKNIEDKLNEKLLEEKNIRKNIENKLKECEEKNLIIREQVQMISDEKKKLYEELEFERNQSFMERLLRRRPSGI